jgi:hypothetical protein
MGTPIVPSSTSEVDEIRRKMADIRLDLHRDVKGVRAGTEAATSWRYYAKHYPWASLAVAAAVGYLLVPRRARSVQVVAAAPEPAETKAEKAAKKGGLLGMVFGFLGPIALRAAQNYVANSLDSYMVQQGARGPGAPGATPRPDPSGRPWSP